LFTRRGEPSRRCLEPPRACVPKADAHPAKVLEAPGIDS
jgi:hypothetical protein